MSDTQLPSADAYCGDANRPDLEVAEHRTIDSNSGGKRRKSKTVEQSHPSVPMLQCMADIEPTEVKWLWPYRFPLGRLSLLVGRPGEGKSYVAMEIAACVSTGRSFCDGSLCQSGSVLIVSAEDDPADTIRPRLDAAEADVNRVHILSAIQYTESDGKKVERAFTLAAVPMLEAALKRLPDCRLVIIDPIGSFLGGGTDTHRDNEVRAVLGPVAEMASKFNVAVVMVAHRRKSNGDFADDSVLGSRAFTGIARAVWHLSRDHDDPKRRLLLPGKNNLTAEGDGLAFRLEGQLAARIVWEKDPVLMTADDAQHAEARSASEKRKPGPRPEARESAAKWLEEELASGPKKPADLKHAAAIARHSWRTVQNAATDLGVRRERIDGFGEGSLWQLPEKDAEERVPESLDNSASLRECETEPACELSTNASVIGAKFADQCEDAPSRRKGRAVKKPMSGASSLFADEVVTSAGLSS